MDKVIRLKIIDSTNRYAKDLVKEGKGSHGLIVVTETQTAGIGRLGKSWYSAPGKGLYCSIIIKPKVEREKYAYLTLLAGLSLAEQFVEEFAVKSMLKWPNDLILNDKKCAGILSEAVLGKDGDDYVIIGIGVNVNINIAEIPEELKAKITSLYLETGKIQNIDNLLRRVHDNFLNKLKNFENNGFKPFIERWREKDYLEGKRASWCSVRKEIVEGYGEGLAESGEYFIRDDNGKLHQVLSGDISLAVK